MATESNNQNVEGARDYHDEDDESGMNPGLSPPHLCRGSSIDKCCRGYDLDRVSAPVIAQIAEVSYRIHLSVNHYFISRKKMVYLSTVWFLFWFSEANRGRKTFSTDESLCRRGEFLTYVPLER